MIVLIIEDMGILAEAYRKACPDTVSAVTIDNLPDAREFFAKNMGEIGVVVINGCVPGDRLNTLPTIKWIKELGFYGAIIAVSSEYQADMSHSAG